ncbi:MAG: GreA/GreB family elongation factor [Candidatus Sumerlaeia bacterium]|nr:GreA/GreB family elongation factor [Candidatus Sumerlaeia bacterium]
MSLTLTIDDRVQIEMFLDSVPDGRTRPEVVPVLRNAIANARVVDPSLVPADCVTMNSHVRLRYEESGESRIVRLAWSRQSRPVADVGESVEAVSILSPVGAALLGSRVGDVITWDAPAGRMRGTVLEVLYQPEAKGDPG